MKYQWLVYSVGKRPADPYVAAEQPVACIAVTGDERHVLLVPLYVLSCAPLVK